MSTGSLRMSNFQFSCGVGSARVDASLFGMFASGMINSPSFLPEANITQLIRSLLTHLSTLSNDIRRIDLQYKFILCFNFYV